MAASTTPAPAENGVATPAVVNTASLYVGDLDREVAEAQLYEVFASVGPVASIRVCRDSITRRSLGYAYVNYNGQLDPTAATRALELLNYSPLNGKPMRIMWSNRDPSLRKSNVGNIFIKNLDKSIDNRALLDTFSAFGNILSAKVATDSSGVSKGYGFVQYDTDEGAQKAISQVNGMVLEGKQVYVGPFQPRQNRSGADIKFTNVYVKNLPESFTDKQLQDMCEEFGPVSSCVIMTDEEGKSKGFGFVNFQDAEQAAAAVDALNGKDIDGKELYIGRAQKKAEREQELKNKFDEARAERIAMFQGMNLFIKNLADEIDDEKLRKEFEPHGTITSARVMRDHNGRSKGFGFVCYSLPEEATKAVTEMNAKHLGGKPIYVAMAQPKDVRKQQLEQMYQQRTQAPMAAMQGPGGPRVPGPPMGMPYGAPPPMFYPGPNGMPPQRPPMGMYPPVGPMPGGPRGPMPGGGPRNFPMMGPGMGPMGPPMPQQAMRGGRGGRGGRGRGPAEGPKGGRGAPMASQGQWGPRGPPRGPVPPPQGVPPPPQVPPQAPPVPPPGVAPTPSAVVPGQGQEQGPLTTAQLAAAPPELQKQMLGERLYPHIQSRQPVLAGKITGMLLEMDNSELLLLLEDEEALTEKVEEAVTVLKQHDAIPA